MSIDNLPPHAWFAAPEGVYTLVSTMNSTINTTPNPFTNNAPSASTPASTPGNNSITGGGGGASAGGINGSLGSINNNGNELQVPPPPPPVYPSKMSVVAVRFPVRGEAEQQRGTGGFGMSMGRRTGKEIETTEGSMSSSSNALEVSTAGTGSTNQGGSNGGGGGQVPPSPATKRRPLTSSFSMLGGLNSFAEPTNGAGGGSRPSRALKGTTSSFIRSWEGLPLSQVQLRTIAEANNGRDTLFGFQTMGKGVFWNEIGKGKKDALSRIIFSAFPTCLDANQQTASHTQIDLLVGFASGDILWMDPLTAKYTRLNKSGIITSSAVTSISWLPPSPSSSDTASLPSTPSVNVPPSILDNRQNLFMTSHADGTVLIWDKDREDWNGFVPNAVPRTIRTDRSGRGGGGGAGGEGGRENEWTDPRIAHGEEGKAIIGREELIVSRCPATDKKGQSMVKFNPVSHWKVSRQGVKAFAVSPDLQFCAIVGEDGCLRIIDLIEEKLLDSFASYFGSLTCVSWSPDGRFVVTGGQDDLLTVYAPLEQHIVAHCLGHSSWVSGVAWDPWRTEERTMRFASIGEDCKLILWDLSSAALTRPKSHVHTHHRRHSASSQLSLHRRSTTDLDPYLPSSSSERDGPTFHPPPRRDDCSVMQPVMVKTLSHDLLSGISLLPDYIVLAARGGQIAQYDRPPTGDLSGLSNEFAASVIRIDARAR